MASSLLYQVPNVIRQSSTRENVETLTEVNI